MHCIQSTHKACKQLKMHHPVLMKPTPYQRMVVDCRPEVEVYQLPLSSLIGQPAFSNSTFRQTDLRSALHRLQATKSKFRHKLKPDHKAGQEVVKLLQVGNSVSLLSHKYC